jgi:hypothetical protein
MKMFSCLLFVFFITLKVHSQNCKTLDTTSFFTSIKFGDQIPGELIACAKKAPSQSPYSIDLSLMYDSLNRDCKRKYSDLFTFLSVPFAFSEITANRKGQIYSVELHSFLDDNYPDDSITYASPGKFISIYKKLESLFGKPSRIEEPSHDDSLFIRDIGMPREIAWECNKIRLQLSARYGSRGKWINTIDILIKNRTFETIEELQSAFLVRKIKFATVNLLQ